MTIKFRTHEQLTRIEARTPRKAGSLGDLGGEIKDFLLSGAPLKEKRRYFNSIINALDEATQHCCNKETAITLARAARDVEWEIEWRAQSPMDNVFYANKDKILKSFGDAISAIQKVRDRLPAGIKRAHVHRERAVVLDRKRHLEILMATPDLSAGMKAVTQRRLRRTNRLEDFVTYLEQKQRH